MTPRPLDARIRALPWEAIHVSLSEQGAARGGALLSAAECRELIRLFGEDGVFRSRVSMERHQFGRGDYAYFAAPLPPLIAALRRGLYAGLAPLANAWAERLGDDTRYPTSAAKFAALCRRSGQRRPTPLLLRYREGGFNRLHRDRYGPIQFPIQALVVLDRRGADYEGGEFLLVENRARQQSIGQAFPLERGELLLFAGGDRPAPGKRGVLRAVHRHGMSRVTRGERHALGIIFHDAT